MFNLKYIPKNFLTALALTGCLLTGFQSIAKADSTCGFALWSGVRRENILPKCHLDFGGRARRRDRYKFYIPARKMSSGASKLIITYPDYYDGKFDTDRIEVNYGRKYSQSAEISEIVWEPDNQLLEIELVEPIEPGQRVEIKLSNVKNPVSGGTYYFHCQVYGSDAFPVAIYVGTWILSIGR